MSRIELVLRASWDTKVMWISMRGNRHADGITVSNGNAGSGKETVHVGFQKGKIILDGIGMIEEKLVDLMPFGGEAHSRRRYEK